MSACIAQYHHRVALKAHRDARYQVDEKAIGNINIQLAALLFTRFSNNYLNTVCHLEMPRTLNPVIRVQVSVEPSYTHGACKIFKDMV